MKNFLKHHLETKDPSSHLIPEVTTLVVLFLAVVALINIYPVFTLIVAATALVWYWGKAFKDYKASKEKPDE